MDRTRLLRRGFTLVELLVVVAVIALLMGLLLPALGKARESARQSQCLANTRQVASLFSYYAEDAQGWYPVMVPRGAPMSQVFGQQWSYGGVAGLFNLRQIAKPNSGSRHYSLGFYSRRAPVGSNANSTNPPAGTNDTPLMARYMESSGDYQMLQCPSDTIDGGENGSAFPQVASEKIGGGAKDNTFIKDGVTASIPQNVIWYNISYIYVAGLRNDEKTQVTLFGDETNAWDSGNPQAGAANPPENYYGTFRKNRPTAQGGPGFDQTDAHGKRGANFAFSDGSARWIEQVFYNNGDDFDPHSLMFDTINRVHWNNTVPEINTTNLKRGVNGSYFVQSID